MTTEIAPILKELQTDHRNMAQLLSMLERCANGIYDEVDADIELMLDIMHYMTVYPDAVHHPKEDLLYSELRAARPDLSQGMGRVADEHSTIASQSIRLRDQLHEAVNGVAVGRKALVADTLRYVEALRRHMRWEESDLFLRLQQLVAGGHPNIESAKMLSKQDPLFGAEVEERFKALYRSLEEHAH